MSVPAPGGDCEAVVVVPLEFYCVGFVDDGDPLALHGVVHCGAGMAVEGGLLSRLEHLQVAGHGENSLTAVNRVFVLDI